MKIFVSWIKFLKLKKLCAYKNKCVPYESCDINRKQKYGEIYDEIKLLYKQEPNSMEELIANVFKCYHNTNIDEERRIQEAELIVRVPHILARYAKDQTRINKLKITYKNLFDFFTSFVLEDLANEEYQEIRDLMWVFE